MYQKLGKREEIYTQFFSKILVDPEHLFNSFKSQDPHAYEASLSHRTWKDLTWETKIPLFNSFAKHIAYKHYNLRLSPWHPSQPITDLIKELSLKGPLIVGGCFGTSHYSIPPRVLEKTLEGRAVYGWVKMDPKNTEPATAHSILLVGAEKTETRQFVYYIDPIDDSDPTHPENQRIFCMSYERLTSPTHLTDTHGFVRNTAPSSIGYAYYLAKE